MMHPPAGSFPWLVMHDMRLHWRQLTATLANTSSRTSWLLGGCALAALHGLGAAAIGYVAPILSPATAAGAGDPALPILEIGIMCVLAWMVSQGLLGTSRMLYDRADLDLLLGSPLRGERVFAARAVALAASSFGSAGVLVLPVANMGAVLDSPAWLSAYPVLAALSLFGTAVGSALAFLLFFLVGPRRARLVSSIAAALLAGAFVLSVQIAALLPDDWREAALAGLASVGSIWVLWVPVEAARGSAVALALLLACAVFVFSAAAWSMGRAFCSASAAAVETSGTLPGSGTDPFRPHGMRFGSGPAAALRRKELRLLVRDPNLFAQLSLQIIYTLPVAIVLMRSSANVPIGLGLAPVIVVIATQVAASLAWIVVSAEDAPELIAAAPVNSRLVDRAKLSAVALPVAALAAAPLIGLALASPRDALLAAVCATCGATSAALVNLWHPMPGKRRGMLRRHAQSKLIAMVEHLLALLWAVATALAVIGSATACVPIALALIVLASCRRGWVSARPEPSARESPTALASRAVG